MTMSGTREITGLREWLGRVRAGLRRRLVGSAALRLFAWVLGALLVLVLADAALRLPAWLRWAHFLIGLAAAGWAFRAWVLPAWRFRPSLTSVALRVEAHEPGARGKLTSAVELEELSSRAAGLERDLATLSARRLASDLAAGVASRRATGPRARDALRRSGSAAAAAVAVAVTLSALFPSAAWTGAVRAAAPWAGAEWPKRTEIHDATAVAIHPRGEPAPLRVVLSDSHRAPDRTDVSARVRVLEGGEVVDRYRALASWQRRTARAGEGGQEGELFEVLAEGVGDAIEYRFESVDDRTEWRRVELVERPAVRAASAEIRRPPYLIATAPESEPESVTVDLGRGLDERASAPASLAGSSVVVELELNKPAVARPGDRAWVEETFGEGTPELDLAVSEDGRAWTLGFELGVSARLGVMLEDEHGIESEEEVVFRFPSLQDGAPSVVVLDPARDVTALPGAVIDLRARARDDVALAALWASAQRFSPAGAEPSGSEGAVEPAGEAETLERASVSAGEVTAEIGARVELERFGASPGDEVRLWATAADVYAYETGRREPVESAVRRVLIVSEEAFVEGVRGDLSAMRREAIRLFEGQQRLAGETARGEAGAGEVRRGQESLTRDLERQVERAEALRERVRRNRLEDAALESLTEGARALSESAAGASRRAGEQAGAREQAEEAPGEDVERAQERAMDELGELIALLDSGEDAWSARRDLEDLAREQRENLETTRELGQETAGLSPEQLSDEQRERLGEITEAQRELAERARSATRGLRETSEKLGESDPATSSALEQAAERLEQSGTSGRMQEAAEQAQENRTARSSSLQQESLEDLEEALERLDDAERARDEQLRRVAQSLVDTIRGLIGTQEGELARLEGAGEALPRGLDGAMIALHRRTIAAQQTALAERELRPAAPPARGGGGRAARRGERPARRTGGPGRGARAGAREPGRAGARARGGGAAPRPARGGSARGSAGGAERGVPRGAGRADRAAACRARGGARGRGGPAGAGGAATTGARAAGARRADRGAVRGDAGALGRGGLPLRAREAGRGARGGVGGAAGRGRAGGGRGAVRAVSLLRGLVAALEEEQTDDDDGFDAGGGSGSGGGGGQQGGGQGLLPGAAQLKLLRSIQGDLLDRTRAADEGRRPAGDLESLGSEQRELSEVGETLIEELSQQGGPGGGNAGPGTDEQPGGAGDEGGAP